MHVTAEVAAGASPPGLVERIWEPFDEATGGVYRVARMPPRFVIKFRRQNRPAGDDRETLMYASGLLDSLPAIRAPRMLAQLSMSDSLTMLCLEDVGEYLVSPWTLSHFRRAAFRLGEFNGAYAAGLPLPETRVPSRSWLRDTVQAHAAAYARLPSLLGHPVLRQCWPPPLLERVNQLWHRRDTVLDFLDTLPQTLCHLDAFPRNLAFDGDELIALDWSNAGIAPVGAEMAAMVPASVFYFDIEPDAMAEVHETSMGAYVDGLRSAGCNADAEQVRRVCSAYMALRYGLYPIGVLLAEEASRRHFERALQRPVTVIARRWSRALHFLLTDRVFRMLMGE